MQDCFAMVASSVATFKSLLHPHFGCNGNRGFPADSALVENQWGLLKKIAKIYKASFLKVHPTSSKWLDLWEIRHQLGWDTLRAIVAVHSSEDALGLGEGIWNRRVFLLSLLLWAISIFGRSTTLIIEQAFIAYSWVRQWPFPTILRVR